MDEELEEVVIDIDEMNIMDEFFDFEAFERSQDILSLEQSNELIEDEWSIDDIINNS